MGNQLTGIAQSQILPVSNYLADNSKYKYESRFMLLYIYICIYMLY